MSQQRGKGMAIFSELKIADFPELCGAPPRTDFKLHVTSCGSIYINIAYWHSLGITIPFLLKKELVLMTMT